MSHSTPGLLLQRVPYLGKKQILKVFTPEQGLLSFFVHSAKLHPFCLAEWIYRDTHKEMLPLEDSSLIDPLLHLKDTYETLSAAGLIAQDLLRTQFPGKKAPELFELTLLYLRKLPLCPDLLAASFRLKVLLYEGLLTREPDLAFSPEEWEQLETLAFARNISMIQKLRGAPYTKIKTLFEERFA